MARINSDQYDSGARTCLNYLSFRRSQNLSGIFWLFELQNDFLRLVTRLHGKKGREKLKNPKMDI